MLREGGAGCRPRSASPTGEASSDVVELIRRNGMSPKTNEVTSSEGSSYAAEQSRRLQVRGICSLRPNGLKAIEQHLLNPHGSIFHFLSEEGPLAQGGGRAPDAMTSYSQKSRALWMNSKNLIGKVSGTLLIEAGDNPRPVSEMR